MNSLLLTGKGMASICADTYEILQVVGWALTIFKIVIPLVIIALGLIDLGKAAVSNKPEEIKKSATSLMWRVAGGILIFFIPTLVMIIFRFVGIFNTTTEQSDFPICEKCITAPWDATGCHGPQQ